MIKLFIIVNFLFSSTDITEPSFLIRRFLNDHSNRSQDKMNIIRKEFSLADDS